MAIKTFHLHQLGRLLSKYKDLVFLEIFRERKFIFEEGDEILIKTGEKEYQAYFIAEKGEIIKSDIYKQIEKK